MPNSIINHRDPIFMSKFWKKKLFGLQGSSLCFSSRYNPQTDGQIDILNRCLESYLRCFYSLQPKKWALWLAWVEWNFNTSFHTATKLTPFEIVYGQALLTIHAYNSGTTKVDVMDQSLKENMVLSILKVQADKCRIERVFEIGDWLYLRLVSYQHMSLAAHLFLKLQPRFYGPFKFFLKLALWLISCNYQNTQSYIQCSMCLI